MLKTAELWDRVLQAEGYKKAKALKKLQDHLWTNDHFVESIAITQEIRDVYKALEDSHLWLYYSWVAALRYAVTDCPAEAVEVIDESLPVAIDESDAYYAGQLLKVRGDVWAQEDEFESAAEAYNQAIAQFEELNGWSMCAEVHLRLAQMQGRQGESALALRNYKDAIARFGEANAPAKVLEVRIEMAELLTAINDPMAAINVLSEALPVARFLENPLAEQKVLRRLGVAHSNRGDVDVAALLLKKAAAMKARGPQDQEAALAMECLAQHNEKFGDREKAKRARARVAPVKQALGLESERTND